jgi:hypothetical protein
MTDLNKELSTYCELHWWNMGSKTLSFKGELKDLLKEQSITFTKRKTDNEYLYVFYFKNIHGITFKTRGTINDFTHYVKQFIQMELVRMGDKSQLYVANTWRSTVNVNY